MEAFTAEKPSGEAKLTNIRISVRSLVEFILRSGDIDNRFSGIDSDAMAMGREAHKKVQARGGPSYRAEVTLSDRTDFPEDGFSLTVEGRADGIIEADGKVTIDEIKGMFFDIRELKEPILVHLAQAKCYAYMYLKKLREAPGDKPPASMISVQLTYVNLDTEKVRRLRQDFSWEDLESWYLDLIGQYRPWAEYRVSHSKAREESIRKMTFPYPYREGQRRLVASVYRTIEQKKKIFIQAPTGSGKTIATVFPAVKAIGEGLGDRIFYLTARTITRTVAEDCFGVLQRNGLEFRVVTITSKEKICPVLEELKSKDNDAKPPCNPESCPRARGHFDRVNQVIYSMITGRGDLHREDILKAAEENQVCPFELTLDLTTWADGIICDYNYVFDPSAKLQRFFASGAKTDSIFLIDEAHNLVDRGRDMYSADLYLEEFQTLIRMLKKNHTGTMLQGQLAVCGGYLEKEKSKQITENGQGPAGNMESFQVMLLNLSGQIEEFLDLPHPQEISDQVLGFYFRVRDFSEALDRFSEKYVMSKRVEEDGRFHVKAVCVDPSADLEECMSRGRSAVLFSATLLPIQYYRKLISTRTDDYTIYASSVFDPSKRKVLIGTDVSTRYQDRGPETYRKIAEYISRVADERDGNYMVFFSSYRMMEDTADAFEKVKNDRIEVVLQNSHMTEAEREQFLARFSRSGSGSSPEMCRPRVLIGFCVMGSYFGEGIDLKGEDLIGVIVVGTGIPQVGADRELLKNYFDRRNMDGFFYSYTCPGMAKVLQAAGRVIRTVKDRGVIVLIDRRFSRQLYREMFPREWSDAEYVTLDNISPRLEQFWKTL